MSAAIPFVSDDGGPHAAGFRGRAGDCVTRALPKVACGNEDNPLPG